MLYSDHILLKFAKKATYHQPLKLIKGLSSAYIAYPIAEHIEKRSIRSKLKELRKYYQLSLKEREIISITRLVNNLEFAKHNVPYYKELFSNLLFEPEKLKRDIKYLNDIPYLTKDIVREQGVRLLSKPLSTIQHHTCKTGGSTGLSCLIYYDQEGADYSSAVTLYAREMIGKKKYLSELHFACRFPDAMAPKWPSTEDYKCFAMNRSNIFFDSIDDEGLEKIWQTLKLRRPYLIHAHPSTIYALACYIEKQYGGDNAFKIFESSGELLEPHVRTTIGRVLQCKIVDRYGLAELGVMAYEVNNNGLFVFGSEGWVESRELENNNHELVFTGFRNQLMPLIRYATGDLAHVTKKHDGVYLTNIVGRIHDVVPINGIAHPTHHIQDMLDHRIGGIQEFQIDLRFSPPILRIVLEATSNPNEVLTKIESFWPNAFLVEFVGHDALIRVGHRAKFRHVVTE